MEPLVVEILTYAPTAFYQCQGCEIVWQQAGVGEALRREQMGANLPADVMQEYAALSAWIVSLVNRCGGRLAVRVVDAVSLEGFVKSLRYRVRRYPAAIIAGGERFAPADLAILEQAIAQRLGVAPAGHEEETSP